MTKSSKAGNAKKRTIRVLVDEVEKPQTKGALPLPDLEAMLQEMVEVGVEKLQASINETLSEVFSILSNTQKDSDDFTVDTVKFTLNISASGEVSLISVAKGSLGGQTGLEFTLVRRKSHSVSNSK